MKLYIKNFQGISEAEINLNGFTVFTGRSNSGKSSIRLAMELVLYNNWEPCYLKMGESHCVVKLTIDEENYIQITKPENTYTVMVKGVKSVYPKVAKSQLEEIDDFGLDYFYDSEGFSHNVHIRRQRDPWYYITYSNQEQSRIIASIFNFDEIKNILKKSYKDKTEVTSQADNLAKDIDNLKLEGQDLNEKLTLLYKLKDKLVIQKILADYLNLEDNVRSVEEKVNAGVVQVDKIGILIANLEKYITVNNYLGSLSLYNEKRGDLNATQININIIKSKLDLLNSIKSKLSKQDTLYSYLKIVGGCIKCSEEIKSSKSSLFNLKQKIKILKSVVENMGYKFILENYLTMHNKLLTVGVEYDFMVSKLKQIVKVKNSLTRFSSLKRYLVTEKKLDEASEHIYNLKLKKRNISKVISKLDSFKAVSPYLESINKLASTSEILGLHKKELNNVLVSIKEAQAVINKSIVCPHCENPIGEFVKRCTND